MTRARAQESLYSSKPYTLTKLFALLLQDYHITNRLQAFTIFRKLPLSKWQAVSTMPPAELSKTVYRALLRWAKAAEGVPFSLRGADVTDVLPEVGVETRAPLEDSKAVIRLAATSFRINKDEQDEQVASERLEAGLRALRHLNSFYKWHVDELRDERELHNSRGTQDVHYAVGQVFQHRTYGYRAVIYGWDAECKREAAWADALGLNHKQPFYKALPDEDDCQKIFGSIRITKYVAQENVIPLSVPRRVTHRALESYFRAYSPSRMRYLPTKQLEFTYPDDYEASDAVSCREDTNILRLGDEEPRDLALRMRSSEWLRDRMHSSGLPTRTSE